MTQRSFVSALRALVANLIPRRRIQLVFLLGLMLVGALAEVLSLAALVPFLATLTDPVQVTKRPLVANVITALGWSDVQDIRWRLTVLFVCTAAVAGMIRFALIYATARINYGMGHELAAEVYRRTLYQPYEVHVARNSSEIVGGLNKVDIVVMVLFGLLNMVSAVLMGIFIVAALLLIDPIIATVALTGFGSIYGVVSVFTRKRLAANSQVINSAYNSRVQCVQEGLGGIRDVLLDHAQPVFARRFNQVDWPFRVAQASNNIIGPSPRFAVEALGMVLIALLGYSMATSESGVAAAIPTLGALALGAQRLMPMLQQTYQGWVLVTGNREVFIEVVALLGQPVSDPTHAEIGPLRFDREIRLEKVSFRYQPHLPLVLRQVDLTIPKGARIGFLGSTGSGKSTATDLFMGLLQPTTGAILVDGTPLTGVTRLAWQRNVAHVPQAIFLADASFAENIAFGVPPDQIDLPRVREAARRAQIANFIEASPTGYETPVGERGVRLSGGQRQRIGIARALYKQVKVIIFDEATSALDTQTEEAVMESIESLDQDLTLLIVAHRLSTLKSCSQVIEIANGVVRRAGTYEAIVGRG